MSEQIYDSIVIGAGLSGLSCAGYLAKGGKKTLILEKNDQVGGVTIPNDIQGCKMCQVLPVAAKFNYGDANGWIKAAQDFGADVRLLPCDPPRIYLRGAENPDITIPRCLTPEAASHWMLELIEAARPDMVEDGLLDDLLPMMREIYDASLEKLTVEWGEVTMKDWFSARTDKEGIRFVFNMLLASCFCTCDGEYTWNYGSVGKAFTQMKIWLCSEGMMTVPLPSAQKGIAEPISDAIQEKFGVEIRLNSEVKKVIIEDGEAKGVEFIDQDGNVQQLFADDVVVSSRWVTYEEMFDPMPSFLSEPIAKATAPEHIMGSAFGMYILDDSIELDAAWFMVFDPSIGSHVLGGLAQSAEQPWNAPEGKQFIWVFRIETSETYATHSLEEIGKEMEKDLEKLFPGFANAVQWRMPVGGRLAPSHWYYNALPKIRSNDPSVPNLYFAGDSTYPMHGILTDGSTSTGALVAEKILSK